MSNDDKCKVYSAVVLAALLYRTEKWTAYDTQSGGFLHDEAA